MFIKDLYENKKGKSPVLSLEIFPPKKDSSIGSLIDVLESMADTSPEFVSVTYGASGNRETEKYSQTVASILKNQYDTETLFHLTCINTTENQIDAVIKRLEILGIENILALRGDIPKQQPLKETQEFHYATDLIKKLAATEKFCIGAACYPEGHIEETEIKNNYKHMKLKQDLGADFFISQLFFDNYYFLQFRERAIACGINKPIAAGIMPILSKSQVNRMIYMCGVSLPAEIIRILHHYSEDEDIKKAGVEYALCQAEGLIREGVDGIHLYTMNHADIAEQGMSRLRAVISND